ncbi:hypothetical protein BDP81DRAFT_19164 [Colletotrichum phormii]|uniref:Uncharacterized protein n=1 Tax=Colletotrichum phormii TaxID=359342 RepID=A0AAJ0A552_9PEZI|nr:uncharacterized protein BDP81DRAFT_19164 [Colletotrichum phormii]KAK1656279.1 hypothetical protein BDP81DRAFT_19164 [Colletotrichum phormii]
MVTGEQKKIPRGESFHYELSTYLPRWTLFAGNCVSFSGCISRKPSPQSTHPIHPFIHPSIHPSIPLLNQYARISKQRGDPSRDTFSVTVCGLFEALRPRYVLCNPLQIRSPLLTEKRKRRRKGRFMTQTGGLRVELNLDSAYCCCSPLHIPWQAKKKEAARQCLHTYRKSWDWGVSCEVPRFKGSFPRILQIAGVFPIPRRHNTEETQYSTRGDEHVQWVGTARYIAVTKTLRENRMALPWPWCPG